jgi:phosphohistidine phosphatase SixA
VGAATWKDSIGSLKGGGRLVTCGSTSGPVGETLIPLVFWKQVHIIGSTMANRREFNDVMRLFFAGRLKAILDEVVPLNGRRGGAGAAGRGQAVRQDRAHALAMRWRAVLACAVLILAAAGPAVAADEALWTLLRAGGQVIMLRHAGTIGTFGDPPGFRLEDCSTQRNLTEAGREQARKIGEAFRAREIPIARVLSSPVCRCLDTARLAFGRVEPWWPLVGEPRAPDQIASRVRQIHEVLGTTPVGGNVVLVTHFVTVQDATGERPQEGELVVFTPRGDGQFTSVGRLAPGGLLCDPRLRSC